MARARAVRSARLLCAVAGCAILGGCSAVSSNSSTSDPPAPAVATTAKAAPRALPVSNASPSVVQPQPPAGSCHARGSGLFSLPDPRCTPGAVSPAVTQANIHATICRRGYTETVRPPESVTEPEKKASLAAYGDAEPLHDFEYDHLVPLELGGAVNDPRNLWPEPGDSPNPKDALEDRLRSMVCDGALALAAARREIATDWVSAYRRLVR
ncbi:MAG TPA: hypothetical protein VMA76_05395 [Solirubrobacteraceae bacterium]|nr:hypothetical protein [Solirubrobacteraceae bacterium]